MAVKYDFMFLYPFSNTFLLKVQNISIPHIKLNFAKMSISFLWFFLSYDKYSNELFNYKMNLYEKSHFHYLFNLFFILIFFLFYFAF